jgi:putative transposase
MARPPRELLPGGVYHVVARGNRGCRIFLDDADHAKYLSLLCEAVDRCHWHLLAYCLMANHVHLLVETPEANLPAGVQWVHGKYGRYFNDRHDMFGHIFQGRYKAIRQEADEQLWQVLRYVALNPVEAGLCRCPRQYRWSSYDRAHGSDVRPLAVHRLSWFMGGRDNEDGLERYQDLVEGDRAYDTPARIEAETRVAPTLVGDGAIVSRHEAPRDGTDEERALPAPH